MDFRCSTVVAANEQGWVQNTKQFKDVCVKDSFQLVKEASLLLVLKLAKPAILCTLSWKQSPLNPAGFSSKSHFAQSLWDKAGPDCSWLEWVNHQRWWRATFGVMAELLWPTWTSTALAHCCHVGTLAGERRMAGMAAAATAAGCFESPLAAWLPWEYSWLRA